MAIEIVFQFFPLKMVIFHGNMLVHQRVSQLQVSPQVEWSCCLARGGFALGCRREDGSLGAVVVVLPYEKGIPSDLASLAELWRAIKPCGMPPRKMGDVSRGIRARAFAAMDTIEKVRKRWVETIFFWGTWWVGSLEGTWWVLKSFNLFFFLLFPFLMIFIGT